MITIAFDVDGTLLKSDDSANENTRTLLRILSEMPDTRIIVWSGGGSEYARMMAKRIHVDHWVDECATKDGFINPDITFDDMDAQLGKVNIRI